MATDVDPQEARRRLCALGDVLRDTVIASRGMLAECRELSPGAASKS